MNKLEKIVAVATLCCVSGLTAASDRSLAIAWTGAGESIAKLASTRVARDAATAIVTTATSWFGLRDEAGRSALATLLPRTEESAAKAGACPVCPEPPCP